MRSHIFVPHPAGKFSAKSFFSETNVAKERLPKDNPSGLGAGGPEFKSRRPDHKSPLFLSPQLVLSTESSLPAVRHIDQHGACFTSAGF